MQPEPALSDRKVEARFVFRWRAPDGRRIRQASRSFSYRERPSWTASTLWGRSRRACARQPPERRGGGIVSVSWFWFLSAQDLFGRNGKRLEVGTSASTQERRPDSRASPTLSRSSMRRWTKKRSISSCSTRFCRFSDLLNREAAMPLVARPIVPRPDCEPASPRTARLHGVSRPQSRWIQGSHGHVCLHTV